MIIFFSNFFWFDLHLQFYYFKWGVSRFILTHPARKEYLLCLCFLVIRFRSKTNKDPQHRFSFPPSSNITLDWRSSWCLQCLFLVSSRERRYIYIYVTIGPTQTRRYLYREYDMLTRHALRLHNSREDVNWLHLIKYMHCTTRRTYLFVLSLVMLPIKQNW